MRPHRFDMLVRVLNRLPDARSAATTRSRRAAVRRVVATLVALALSAPERSATADTPNHPGHRLHERKTQRREKRHARLKRRRQRQRRQQDGDNPPGEPHPNSRGNSLLIGNLATARATIRVICGEYPYPNHCPLLAVFDITLGQQRLFDTSATHAYCQVSTRYWFEFNNPFDGRPWIVAAVSDGSTRSCEPSGPFALNQYGMSEGESVSPTLEGHTFTIRRNDDKSDFKFFDFTLSAAL